MTTKNSISTTKPPSPSSLPLLSTQQDYVPTPPRVPASSASRQMRQLQPRWLQICLNLDATPRRVRSEERLTVPIPLVNDFGEPSEICCNDVLVHGGCVTWNTWNGRESSLEEMAKNWEIVLHASRGKTNGYWNEQGAAGRVAGQVKTW
ncbi:hypothetical protein Scep_009510 [Stephania cephalantha]|uniref:Uncharacterized protein n=1 Tax=Stephania cephalantha TaxID=152367 RepID=A0AAP0JTZ6_9MAGN